MCTVADEINRELITELFYIIFYIMRNFANTLTRHDYRDRHSKISYRYESAYENYKTFIIQRLFMHHARNLFLQRE